jgi:hypothetical protein
MARRMLDPDLQQRFARRCADAALGYSAASTAAYAAMAGQVLNFWSDVLQPPAPPRPQPASQLWNWPVPMAPTPPAASPPLFNPFAWMLPPAPAPAPALMPANPWEAMSAFANAMSGALSAMSATPVRPLAGPANPMSAWLTMFPFAAPTSAWPMAFMMMSSGVPHAVAWPTAEANAAVLDAADAATRSIKKVFASYQTDGGHATSLGNWPPTEMLTLMAMVPLNVGTMFTALRMS